MKAAPRRKRGETRPHILKTARKLVIRDGADAVSLRAVAAEAGYSPASLYEHFQSKEDLLRELAADVLVRLDGFLGKVSEELPPDFRLIEYGCAYVHFARAHPEDFLLLFSHLRSQRMLPTEGLTEGNPYTRLHRAAKIGIERGTFPSTSPLGPETIAYGLWSCAHGQAMLQLTHLRDFGADFESADRSLLGAFVHGLKSASHPIP